MTKFEDIPNHTLQFVFNDCTSDYKSLINKSNKCTMEVRQIRVLAPEVFHSVNKLNSVHMKTLFEEIVNSKRHKNDLAETI